MVVAAVAQLTLPSSPQRALLPLTPPPRRRHARRNVIVPLFMAPMYADMNRLEDAIRADGVTYTIVRPTYLQVRGSAAPGLHAPRLFPAPSR